MTKDTSNNKEQLKAAARKKVKKSFSLDDFKNKKGLSDTSLEFKEQSWIPVSEALKDIVSLPGLPAGHITLLRGHSDTGKTTCLLEAGANAQKVGALPVFIITEMKWSWEHAQDMGLDLDGEYLYVDRSNLNTIEDVASFILDLIDEQEKGKLPYDLVFLWDSIGSIPCELSVTSKKNNNEWNAGAVSTQFGNNVNQKILLSRKKSYPYTNSLVAINKVWTQKPDNPMGQPKLMNKNGMTMWYDATLVLTFGNVTNPGTSKIQAIKDGKKVEFAKRTNIQVEKNHLGSVQSRGRIVMTGHGFIKDHKRDIDRYKEEHRDHWNKLLGGLDFELEDEGDMEEDPIITNKLKEKDV